jgi:SAM-dependent methyltransferase
MQWFRGPRADPLAYVAVSRPARSLVGDDGWWASHWETAPAEIGHFLGLDGIKLADTAIADFGCGDGIMAGGLAWLTGASVVGFDLDPTDSATLRAEAKARGFDLSKADVQFRGATAGAIDARDGEFDVGVSWSVLEHVFDRVGYMREARRVIKPHGHLFVQVWPLWHSEHGHHLWTWLKPFDHLRYSRDEIVEILRNLGDLPAPLEIPGGTVETVGEFLAAMQMSREEWMSQVMASYDTCSRITLDEIQGLLSEHGFGISRVELMTGQFHVPVDLQSIPLTRLSLSGFKLTAWRKP